MSELEKILNKDEKILWQGKPRPRIYFIESILPVLLASLGIIVLSNLLTFIIGFINVSSLDASQLTFIKISQQILFYLALLIAVLGPIFSYLSWKYLLYVLTDKRAIIQSGIIGRDFKMIDYDQFKDADVSVGLDDKLIGGNTGTIHIYTGETGINSSYYANRTHLSSYRISYDFSHIQDPYDVFAKFKKTSFDVKTDMDYPNKMRPQENTGYKTEYKSKD